MYYLVKLCNTLAFFEDVHCFPNLQHQTVRNRTREAVNGCKRKLKIAQPKRGKQAMTSAWYSTWWPLLNDVLWKWCWEQDSMSSLIKGSSFTDDELSKSNWYQTGIRTGQWSNGSLSYKCTVHRSEEKFKGTLEKILEVLIRFILQRTSLINDKRDISRWDVFIHECSNKTIYR